MNVLSQRLNTAVDFIKKNYRISEAGIARKLGVTASSLNMAKTGERTPTWDLLLTLCDNYPINFWWLRSGEGSMIKEDREQMLLKRIAELEGRIRELEGKE